MSEFDMSQVLEDFGFEHDTRGHLVSIFGMSFRLMTSYHIQDIFISTEVLGTPEMVLWRKTLS